MKTAKQQFIDAMAKEGIEIHSIYQVDSDDDKTSKIQLEIKDPGQVSAFREIHKNNRYDKDLYSQMFDEVLSKTSLTLNNACITD